MALHIVVDAVARSVFRDPLPGTLEITQYLWMPAMISLSLGYAMYRGEHIRVDLLTSGAGTRTRRVVEIGGAFLSLAVLVVVAWAGVDRARASVGTFEHSAGSDWVPIWPGRALVAIGLVVLVLQVLAQLMRAFRNEFQNADQYLIMPGDSAPAPAIGETSLTPNVLEKTPLTSKRALQ
ncbi:TRAP transporter small permease subunit [Nocardioides sp. NPDC051685]|uniref:TRAP transporter small permease subunit n=1 Tax=Nocardioides sp. NPDC051685 TaxID=3364334 RepID=UPI0037B89373